MAPDRPKHRLASAALAIALILGATAAKSDAPSLRLATNPYGALGTLIPEGTDAQHPFFQPLGTNGRACTTCHRPASGFALSLRDVRELFASTRGSDPLFAPFDGADCPSKRGAPTEIHSLLLTRGVIRIPLPWPPRDAAGRLIAPEFELTIAPADDPTGCNMGPDRGLAAGTVSVYRRPPSAAQMNFKTLRADGQGSPLQGSLMWDGRQPTLEAQAIEASQSHLQAARSPDEAVLARLVALQTGAFTAQLADLAAGPLDAQGALGGPANLEAQIPLPAGGSTFTEFSAWVGRPGRQGSIARGQTLFNGREFAVRDVDGFNERPGVGNPAQGVTCSTCHNIGSSGADFFADPQRNIGIGGTGVRSGGPPPAADLPRFTLTCRKGSRPGFLGLGPIVTNDPGRALITGKCADIGRFTVPQLRALAAREPYFHDGSAKSLDEVVDFYDRRFAIGLTAEERQDLINFLAAL
jgi:cytochrome c peroxidase